MSFPLRLSQNPFLDLLPSDMITADDLEEIDTLIDVEPEDEPPYFGDFPTTEELFTELKAMSEAELDYQWERFHEMCAQGNGDDHRYYQIFMNQFLRSYVGH